MDSFFQNPNIQARVTEFLGGETLDDATAVYVTRCDAHRYIPCELRPPGGLAHFLTESGDVARSLWDRRSLLFHLDIEYVNFDYPAEAYLDPARSFEIQQPVVRAVEQILAGYGIAPIHLVTGRGHHFTWRIAQDSPTFSRLVALGECPAHLRARYDRPLPPSGDSVAPALADAFLGQARVMEYLLHRIKRESAPYCSIPVEATAVAVGPSDRGREMVSIDISEYGDPLHTRPIRMPFSFYHKPWVKGMHADPAVGARLPRLIVVPLHEMGVGQAIDIMKAPEAVNDLAGRCSVRIPDQPEGTMVLIRAYEQSDLHGFHEWFDSEEHEPPERWPETYDRAPVGALPPCPRYVLEHPNDLLMKPAGMVMVVRSLLALGWHPRHIAGLIRSKFERNFGWGAEWYTYDAGMRADFYTRLFSGLFAVGVDDLVDFNCISTREKGYCFQAPGGCALDLYRQSLLKRREHDKLGCRPFNRLLL